MAVQLGQAFIALHADGTHLGAEVRAQMEAALAGASAAAGASGTAAGEGLGGTRVAAQEATAALGQMGEAGAAAGAKIAASSGEADAAIGRTSKVADEAAAAIARTGTAAKLAAADSVKAADAQVASTKKVKAAADEAAKSSTLFGFTWKQIGAGAAAIGVYDAIKSAGNFQQQLTRLVTSANEVPGNLKLVSQGILDMGSQVGFSANQMSQGMYIVESAGYHGKAGLDALKASAEIAKQENADLVTTTQAVTTTMRDYGPAVGSAADVASKLNEAVAFGKTNLQDFSAALHSVEPNAAAAHVKLEDVLGSLSTMTNSGMSAQQAAQNLAHTLSNYEKPTQPVINALAQIGLNAADVTAQLGEKGISGTLIEVSDAIKAHMGPAGEVAVNALNQNKVAAQDLVTMMDQMPEAEQKLSTGLLDGTVSIKDYRTAVREMGGQAGDMGMQFLSLYQSSDGFNSILKAGGPQVQTYLGYLARSTGTVDALRTALLLTADGGQKVTDAVKGIKDTAAQADGNVSKWALTQQTFNQRFAEAKASIENFGTAIAMKALPALSDMLGAFNDHVVPALKTFGTDAGNVIGTVVKWFQSLPQPVQVAAGAIAAFKLLDLVGWLDKLKTGFTLGKAAVSDFADKAKASLATVKTAYVETKVIAEAQLMNGLGGAMPVLGTAQAKIEGLGAAAVQTAKVGFTALGKGAMGLINAFGGPWVVAIGAAIGVVMLLMNATKQHDEAVKKATDDVLAWQRAVSLAPDSNAGQTGFARIQELKSQIADTEAQINRLTDGGILGSSGGKFGAGVGAAVANLRSKLNDLHHELDVGSAQWQKEEAAMTPVQKAQEAMKIATDEYNAAVAKTGSYSAPEAVAALGRLRDAQDKVKKATDDANIASQTQIDHLQTLAQANMDAADSQLAADTAQSAAVASVIAYNDHVKQGAKYTGDLTADSQALTAQMRDLAKAHADNAVKQFEANQLQATGKKVTDDGTVANAEMLKSLQDTAAHLTGPAHDAVQKYIDILKQNAVGYGDLQGAVDMWHLDSVGKWDDNTRVLGSATAQQIQDLQGLGFAVKTLPDGKVVVTSDTGPARDQINQMIQDYSEAQISINTANFGPASARDAQGHNLFSYIAPQHWAGGYTGDGGKYQPMGVVHGGEFVLTKEQTAKAGVANLYALAESLNGYAGGGLVGKMRTNFPTVVNPLVVGAVEREIKSLADAARQMAMAVGGPPTDPLGNVALGLQAATARGWGGMDEWSALYKLWQRESGWRNTAQNPTSTAYGIAQFLDPTWASYGYRKTSDAGTQIQAGLNYIGSRYGDPLRAWAHEVSAGWYKNGISNVPFAMPAVLHQGERVLTAAENARFGRGGGTTITYAPQYTLPASASAEQVDALVRRNLARDFAHGLGDAGFDSIGVS